MTYANGDKMTAVYNGYGQMIAEKWYDRYDNRIAYYKYAYDSQGNVVRSIDILARKMYNYMYEDGKLTYACECKISLDSNNYIIAKTALYTVYYFYDNEDNLVRKRTVFADGKEQTVTYETAENETQLVKTAIGEHSFVSVAKTDSFGRKELKEDRGRFHVFLSNLIISPVRTRNRPLSLLKNRLLDVLTSILTWGGIISLMFDLLDKKFDGYITI